MLSISSSCHSAADGRFLSRFKYSGVGVVTERLSPLATCVLSSHHSRCGMVAWSLVFIVAAPFTAVHRRSAPGTARYSGRVYFPPPSSLLPDSAGCVVTVKSAFITVGPASLCSSPTALALQALADLVSKFPKCVFRAIHTCIVKGYFESVFSAACVRVTL